jgi:glyoxylase-like metal-dependent hydrolase (beta-lactamase superfamily II)
MTLARAHGHLVVLRSTVVTLLAGSALAASVVGAQQPPATSGGSAPAAAGLELRSIKVQGNVWMISGAGANVAVQVGDEGVVVVDTGAAGRTPALLAAIRQITTRPIRYVINTSVTPDHVGGNAEIARLAGGATDGRGTGVTPAVIAHEGVFTAMARPQANGESPFPSAAWPTDAYTVRQRNIFFNGEPIDIVHQPSAHSDGDSIVYFRGSNVLVTGDIFTTTRLPLVDQTRGGTLGGMVTALNALLDIAVPAGNQEGGTYIVPGHGRVCDEADLLEYRDMAVMVRDRMQELVRTQKLTLDQVKARRPVIGWERRYSAPEWTTDMFIEAVYREMSGGGGR